MGLHSNTCEKLENKELCKAVIEALQRNFGKSYIQRKYDLTRHELDQILRFYDKDLLQQTEEIM